jgi:hypothetical protein
MAKYDPLKAFLSSQMSQHLAMSFAQIEQILGFKLPASARHHQAWWANEAAGHVQARAWLAAGFETEQVDIEGHALVFRRVTASNGMQEEPRMFEPQDPQSPKKLGRHPLIGSMKGTFTIEPGYDLTKPMYTDEEWAEIEGEMLANFDRLFPDGIK